MTKPEVKNDFTPVPQAITGGLNSTKSRYDENVIYCIGDEPFQLEYNIVEDKWAIMKYDKIIDDPK